MTAGFSLVIALLAGAPDAPTGASQAAKSPEAPAKPANGCGPAPAGIEPGEVFVCAPRPQGYRIDPDVLEANRAKLRGRPKRPERMADNSCASVGPMGCTGMGGAGIDIVGGAMVAATMVAKAIRGQNVGEMFITDRRPTEYELYQEAKREREAKEAEAAAAATANRGGEPRGEERDPSQDE